MNVRPIPAALTAVALSAGLAFGAGCGRENESQSNQGVQTPQGGNTVVETGPTTLQSTGTEPTVTQGSGGG